MVIFGIVPEEASGKKKVNYKGIMSGTSDYVLVNWPETITFKTLGSYGIKQLRQLIDTDILFARYIQICCNILVSLHSIHQPSVHRPVARIFEGGGGSFLWIVDLGPMQA